MAILRLSNGEVITGYSEINELIVPVGMEVGRFTYPEHLEAKVKEMAKPLDQGWCRIYIWRTLCKCG